MSELKKDDRVITIVDVPPIPAGTRGTVTAVGIALTVKYDGDSSPGRITPRDAVEKISMAAFAKAGAKKGGAKKAAAKKPAAKNAVAKKPAAKKAAAKKPAGKKPAAKKGGAKKSK
ncbi:MAG TPA: hypothetical protein VFO89_08375 [Thermoanaerobaculia bacterium]|nr:hypothetical protein [Thermoanaerobaculia bacterium]